MKIEKLNYRHKAFKEFEFNYQVTFPESDWKRYHAFITAAAEFFGKSHSFDLAIKWRVYREAVEKVGWCSRPGSINFGSI